MRDDAMQIVVREEGADIGMKGVGLKSFFSKILTLR